MAALFVAALVLVPTIPGLVLGIVKDGSPFKRDWWTS